MLCFFYSSFAFVVCVCECPYDPFHILDSFFFFICAVELFPMASRPPSLSPPSQLVADALASVECADSVRIVCNGLVRFTTTHLSATMVEFTAVRLATPSLAQNRRRLGNRQNSEETMSAVRNEPMPGLDRYEIRKLIAVSTISVLLFLSMAVTTFPSIHLSNALLISICPLALYCIGILPWLVMEESITIVQNLGIKTRKRYFYGFESVQFVEKDVLRSVFIHEYVFHCQFQCALACVVRHKSSLLLIFHEVYPGIQALEEVLQCIHQHLY